jgi:hypothetical protein
MTENQKNHKKITEFDFTGEGEWIVVNRSQGKGKVFGISLDEMMKLQDRQDMPPIFLLFITEAIIRLGGCTVQGLFRIPGNFELVRTLREQLNEGEQRIAANTNPHIVASLLKDWLRSLPEPVIPREFYDQCLNSASKPRDCIRLVEALPKTHALVLTYLISWLQKHMLDPATQKMTKMDVKSLAMVLTPCLMDESATEQLNDVVGVKFHFTQQIKFIVNLLMLLGMEDTERDIEDPHENRKSRPRTRLVVGGEFVQPIQKSVLQQINKQQSDSFRRISESTKLLTRGTLGAQGLIRLRLQKRNEAKKKDTKI